MNITDKVQKLGEHLLGWANATKAEEVAMSEAVEEAKESTEAPVKNETDEKVNAIYNFLFTEDANEQVEEVEAEADAEVEAKTEEPVAEETKEEIPAWVKEFKALVEEKDKKIAALESELNGDNKNTEDPLVHNPEAEAKSKKSWKGGDPKQAPDDPTAAFFHNFG